MLRKSKRNLRYHRQQVTDGSQKQKGITMNEEIYNIAYDALTTIMELSGIILDDETIDAASAYTIVKSIRKISVQTKQIMFEKKKKPTTKK